MLKQIYNGENEPITVVTDFRSTTIKPKDFADVEIPEDAVFNQSEFYVQEEGNWYAKTSNCFTGADIEIYNAD
jgi:hypothetical protein